MRQRRADFGEVTGTALSVLLWPLQKLMEGVGWLLEKLDLIPDGIERAGWKRPDSGLFRLCGNGMKNPGAWLKGVAMVI